ncbi:unnamed protein product [Prunus brigantina]
MLRPLTILFLLADPPKHVVNPAKPATQARASMATTKGSVFHTPSPKPEWIIDSGATDHTTFDPSQLISCKPSTQLVVSNANSTPSPVAEEVSLYISKFIHLDSILIVPSLDHNLLSAAQLTTTFGVYCITFWLNHCVF